jgi:hypothetical protein
MPDAPTTEAPASTEPAPGGQDDLGDAGKRALVEERSARASAEKTARALQKELEALRAGAMSEQEKAIEKARAEARSETLSAANRRILAAEVKAAAASRLADPADAVRFLDLEQFHVDEDGNVDQKSIARALKELLEAKPYLAAGASKPSGSADGGPRGATPPQSPSEVMNQWLRGGRTRP